MEPAQPPVLAGDVARVPVQVTCQDTGAPPLSVLARVTRVLSGETQEQVWAQLRAALRAGGMPEDELVLLRAGRGADESWTELRVLAPEPGD